MLYMSHRGSHYVIVSSLSHALYALGPACFQQDPNPKHMTYAFSDVVTYQTFYTTGVVHNENVTVAQKNCK